jgi:hypothetical protein
MNGLPKQLIAAAPPTQRAWRVMMNCERGWMMLDVNKPHIDMGQNAGTLDTLSHSWYSWM